VSQSKTYVLVAGSHAWLESARAEARALELLKIPAKVESDGSRYRVVVGRYDSSAAASRAQTEYKSLGHVFHVVAE
jgi:cell division protein FtsN